MRSLNTSREHTMFILNSWIEKASAKELEGVSVPALPRIRKLLSQYNPLIKERLKKYHEKAKASIAERCELSSVNSSIMENQSRKAEAYSALRSAKLNKQGIEKETLEMLSSDEEETKDSLIGLEDEERPTRRDALKKVTLDGGITGMPTKGNPELTQQRLKGISTTERISLPSVTPVVTETKKNDYLVDERLGNCYRAQQESAERRQAPIDHPKSQPLKQRVTTEGEHPINKLELNEFDQAQAGHRQSLYRDNFKPDVGAYRRIGDHPQWSKPEERPINGLSYPWKTGEQLFEANRYRPPWGEYERRNLEERLYARYSRMYEIGNGEANRRFSGKRSDYPMFRQQLLRDYSLLWESEPYFLLLKIANSVTDAVYEHIKSAWVMRNPREALDRIWEILEDLYGDPRGLLENAIQEIKWQTGSLLSKVSALQCYRTKLRNLESVASSISMAAELSRPKLLFRIVDCFNPALQAQFAQEYRDCRQWTFEVVLEFINRQICNLQFRESHSYDISAIIDEDETSKAHRKSYFERKQTKARANNLQVAIKETNRSLPKNDAHNVVSQNLRKACNESNCVVHPLAQHKTIDCRQFLNKTIKERRELVKAHDLCYYCLQKHYARSCTNKKRCEKCQGAHSPLLHLEVMTREKAILERQLIGAWQTEKSCLKA